MFSNGDGTLMSVGVDGGTPVTLASSAAWLPIHLVADDATVYWAVDFWIDASAFAGSAVLQMPLEGGPITNRPAGLPISGLAVSSAGLFWTSWEFGCNGNCVGDGGVMQAPLLGGGPETLAQSRLARSVVADSTQVYFIDSLFIVNVPVGGGSETSLVSGPITVMNGVIGDLAMDSTSLYWAELAPADARTSLMRTQRATGATTTLATGQYHPTIIGLVVDDGNLYWTDNGPANNGQGAIVRLSIAGGLPVTLADHLNLPLDLAVDSTSVYWTSADGVMKLTPK
jgi:hypothetical protein